MIGLVVLLVLAWAVMPWVCLAVGVRRGHPIIGWVSGLVPFGLGLPIVLAWPRKP